MGMGRKLKLRRDKETEPPITRMFLERMERDGRGPEFRALRRKKLSEGIPASAAYWQAMEEMGYEGHSQEVKYYRLHKKNLHVHSAEQDLYEQLAKDRKDTIVDDFEQALMLLPVSAPRVEVLEWIEAHPAMMRQDRQGGLEPILITADDILRAPHGRAPSRAAACQLQHWVNRPNEFFKAVMSELKKKASNETSDKDKDDPNAVADLEDINALLESFGGG